MIKSQLYCIAMDVRIKIVIQFSGNGLLPYVVGNQIEITQKFLTADDSEMAYDNAHATIERYLKG